MRQADIQLSLEAVKALRDQANTEMQTAGLASCQLALGLGGEVVFTETLGDAPPDARYVIYSCTKAIVASVVWQLIGEGKLEVSEPVATYWPGFAKHGKDKVTVEHTLVHTAGFPSGPLTEEAYTSREERVRQMEEWTLDTEPGTHFAYHAGSASAVWAELIERIDGKDYRVAIRERLLDPLGLDRLELGVPRDRLRDVQRSVPTGTPSTPEEFEAFLGVKLPPELLAMFAAISANTGTSSEAPAALPEIPDFGLLMAEFGVPGGGGVSDAASLALFYQALLHDPRGLWDPEVLRDATGNVRNRLPDFFGRPAFRSLGLEIAGDGEWAHTRIGAGATSPGTFGHLGAGGQVAWADPVSGLSFVFLTNGSDRNSVRQLKRDATLTRLAAACAT